MSNEELQNYFSLRNFNLNKLWGITPNDVRVYGGLDSDTPMPKDEVDSYLLLNNTNLEIKLMELSNCGNMTTANPIGHVLKAKFESQENSVKNSLVVLKEIAEIPDFARSVLDKQISFKDLLNIKNSKNGEEFRTWFHNNCNGDDKIIAKEYIKMLEKTPKVASLPSKILRYVVTTGIGFIPIVGPLLGASSGFIDSFFIEKWGPGHSPKFFINNLKQLSK
jgi:hypothetical protein